MYICVTCLYSKLQWFGIYIVCLIQEIVLCIIARYSVYIYNIYTYTYICIYTYTTQRAIMPSTISWIKQTI